MLQSRFADLARVSAPRAHILRGLCLGALALLTVSAVQADRPRAVMTEGDGISKVHIAVWDAETRDEIALLKLGEPVRIEVGQRVIVRVLSPNDGNRDQVRHYLSSTLKPRGTRGFFIPSEPDFKRGMLTIEGTKPTGTSRGVGLSYEISDKIGVTKPYLRSGTINVEVLPATTAPAPTTPPPTPVAGDLLSHIYQAIVHREPDANHRAQWEQRLVQNGHEGVVELVLTLAKSQESQTAVYDRGITQEQRVLALYEHMWGWPAGQVRPAELQSSLGIIARGGIEDLAIRFANSPEFHSYHGNDYSHGRVVQQRKPIR